MDILSLAVEIRLLHCCTSEINSERPEGHTVVIHVKDDQLTYRVHEGCMCPQSQTFLKQIY